MGHTSSEEVRARSVHKIRNGDRSKADHSYPSFLRYLQLEVNVPSISIKLFQRQHAGSQNLIPLSNSRGSRAYHRCLLREFQSATA